jgi:peptidoglycan/LPS O-acetylase OafA/YrhL
MSSEEQNKGNHFLYEIEGLRGILAMWVFISHLMWGSGFVVFLLLDSKHDSYFQYIKKRFLRLYPVFILTTAIGAILFSLHLGILGGDYQGPNVFVRSPEYYAQTTKVFLLHAFMFQGFLRDLGPIVLNPPSWSISLEWQFYLIAPFLFFLLRKRWGAIALVLVLAAIIKNLLHPSGILNVHWATLVDQIIPFTVGMLSYKLYQQRYYSQNSALIGTLIAIVLLITLYTCQSFLISIFSDHQQVPIPDCIPLVIWAVVLLSIIARTATSDFYGENIISRFLKHPYLQLLGKLSYSIYLIHQLVIFIFLLFAGSFVLKMQPARAFFFESLILIPISLALAYLSNIFLEQPFINLGRKLTRKFDVLANYGL